MTRAVYAHGGDWVPPGMDYAAFRDHGLRLAMRYVVPSIPGKMVSRAEVDSAHARSVDVAFVYETTGTTWQGGHDAGVADGIAAYAAVRSLGAPLSCAVYHAVDSPVLQHAMSVVLDWVRGLLSSMHGYRVGVYGEYTVCEAVERIYPQVFRWQTEAWSGGQVSPGADILQLGTAGIGGIDIDLDVIYSPHIGQWYANQASQPQSPYGEDMYSGQITSAGLTPVPVQPGSCSQVVLFADTGLMGNHSQRVRVALHSEAKGWSQIEAIELSAAQPFVLNMQQHDVNAVSYARTASDGTGSIGYLIQ